MLQPMRALLLAAMYASGASAGACASPANDGARRATEPPPATAVSEVHGDGAGARARAPDVTSTAVDARVDSTRGDDGAAADARADLDAGAVGDDASATEAASSRLAPAALADRLAEASRLLRAAGVRSPPSARLPPKHGRHDELRVAYAEGRALAYRGRPSQVRGWMAIAKFGRADPGVAATRGPLSRYDLAVTSAGEQAWLHVIVPATDIAPEGASGHHFALYGDQRWVALADRLRPGVDYLPFKRESSASLNRQWGRELVVADLVTLAREFHLRTGTVLGIGDLSEVTGGSIPDHWTHKHGIDADVYLVRFDSPDPRPSAEADSHEGGAHPVCMWHTYRRGQSLWSPRADARDEVETEIGTSGETVTARRLRALAELVLADDDIAVFVHNDPVVLEPFDELAGARRPGRRFLHAENRGYWPEHRDHVHLRWATGTLQVGAVPRP